MKTFFLTSVKILVLSLCMYQGYAQDRLFTYTYQSTVLNKGQRELEVWNTFRTGRQDYYGRLDTRAEFEIGLGKNVQTAFYLNSTSKTSLQQAGIVSFFDTETEMSFSNEWKLKLTDPVANPVGVGLYAEYGIASNEFELETKLLLDKKINNLLVAANAVLELEFEPEIEATPEGQEVEFEVEKKPELYLAFAYSLNPRFAVTIENAFKNVVEEGELEHSALYSGVGLSYSMDNFWINATVMPQVAAFKGKTNNQSLNLAEYEKLQCRILFSFIL